MKDYIKDFKYLIFNNVNIIWIVIEHILNIPIIIILTVLITFYLCNIHAENIILSNIVIGIASGITASIMMQSYIDMRELRRDTYKLLQLWCDVYNIDRLNPKYNDNSKQVDIKDYVNSRQHIICEMNNIISNRYSFTKFRCSIDSNIQNFICKLESQLGPYAEENDGYKYAYSVICLLGTNNHYHNKFPNEHLYIQDIISILFACMNTYSPFFREYLIFKKSGITNRDNFNNVITYIKILNTKILKDPDESSTIARRQTIKALQEYIHDQL